MSAEIIKLDIEGQEFECEVEFEFTPGEPAVKTGHPDDRQPGTPDEWEILGLAILIECPHMTDKNDIGFLIEDLFEIIVEKLQELSE